MTKKTYMQPQVAETFIRMDNMILDTSTTTWSEDNESGTGTLNDEEADGDGLSRRHFNLWDE